MNMARFSVDVLARHLPLACLERTGLEGLFQSWRGASGRRYVCSVHAIETPPEFDCARAIVVGVRKAVSGAEIAFVFQPDAEAESDGLRRWAEIAGACGVGEWHVHLLADTREDREFALADLSPRRLALAA
jgi:hypothetical protein